MTRSQRILGSDSLPGEGREEQNKDFRLPLSVRRFEPPKPSKLTLCVSTKTKIQVARRKGDHPTLLAGLITSTPQQADPIPCRAATLEILPRRGGNPQRGRSPGERPVPRSHRQTAPLPAAA